MGAFRASSTWSRSSGCELPEVIQTRATKEDIFIKPELDEVYAKDENAILLKCPSEDIACELHINMFPQYKIEALTMLSTADKLETFCGPLKQYTETVFGTGIVEDCDLKDTSSDELTGLYRYDIEIQKSGIVDLTLKLMSPSDEICIFGILLQIAPNPNGITTLLPNTAINMNNVQQMLDGCKHKLSDGAEKCKMFMQNSLINQSHLTPHQSSHHLNVTETSESLIDIPASTMLLENSLKTHIDLRFQELEQKLNARIDELNLAQMAKLERILKILER